MNITIEVKIKNQSGYSSKALEEVSIDVSAPKLNPRYFAQLVNDCVETAITKANTAIEATPIPDPATNESKADF